MRLIKCDGPTGLALTCGTTIPLLESGKPPENWTTDRGKDYCPSCTLKRGIQAPKMSEDEKLVRRLLMRERGLREKEISFVENIARRVIDEKRDLSPDQRKYARDIDDRLDR